MRIKKIQLKDYKRFKDLTINLGDAPKRIVALVGPNGCGKSSVLDGMLYKGFFHGYSIGDKGGKDYRYHSLSQDPNYNSFENINIEFIEGDYPHIFEQKRSRGEANTMFAFRSPYRYNGNLKVTVSQAVSDIKDNNYGATASSDLDDKMEQNYRRINILYNKYLHSTDCRPSEAKRKIVGDLNQSLTNCLDIKIESLGDIENNQGTLFFTKPDYTKSFEYNVLSAGEKEVVDILLDLYIRQEEYNDTIFLIDEPELHINPSIQRKLLIEINKMIGENCQIWVATHSIGYLRALQEELASECQIIAFKENTPWASEPQVLTPMVKSRANWQAIFETALDDLTQLVSPKRIIYCEGFHKPGIGGAEKGMDAQVFNNIFGENYPDTLFVSSGGNTELDQRSEVALSILSKVFPEVEIWVFKDRDMSSGKPNTENDRQEYLRLNPQNHRVMRRWEIENYLYDKEILKKYCSCNGKTFDEQCYDEFVSDVINQNLKDATGRIKNFCNITTSINADKFKIELSKYISPETMVYQELEACIFGRD